MLRGGLGLEDVSVTVSFGESSNRIMGLWPYPM